MAAATQTWVYKVLTSLAPTALLRTKQVPDEEAAKREAKRHVENVRKAFFEEGVVPNGGLGLIVALLALLLRVTYRPGLRGIPGPFLARISPLDRILTALSGHQFKTHIKYHEKYGPLVRVGPNHVSFSDPDLLPIVYGITSKFYKSDFYTLFDVTLKGESIQTVFAVRDEAAHKALKRPVANAYSMSTLNIDLGKWLQWYAFDVITSITFSNRLGFLEEEKDIAGIIDAIEGCLAYNSVIGEVPTLHRFLLGNRAIGSIANLVPALARLNSTGYIVKFAAKQLERYQTTDKSAYQLRDMLARFKRSRDGEHVMTDKELLSHATSNIFAGSDTTAISLRSMLYYLCKNPRCYNKLVEEIDTMDRNGELSKVVTFAEANRMKLPPSVYERSYAWLPEGTIVGVNPWVVSRDKSVYGRDVDEYRPERWLETDATASKRMERNFLAFGSGARTCLGKNISLLEMSKLIPQLLRDYHIELSDPRAEWTLTDHWSSSLVLPPNIAASTFEEILDRLSEIVGPDNVSRNASHGALQGPHGQNSYGDPYAMEKSQVPKASGAVRPGNVGEVQQVVHLANMYKLPLWTVSRGKNLGYGASAPVASGSLVLDLHRLNRIIEVNEEYAYAVVEPGVSFFDLYEYIKDKGLKLWPSVPAIGWGSVVGNTLDRGFGYTPDGEHTQRQCGMEVVLPNGELLKTGMGAMDGNIAFPLYKWGFGPSVDGLFYQSNLGIVTKIGIHMTPAPEFLMACDISVPREEDLIPLVGILSDLQRRHIIQSSPSISNVFRQCMTSNDPAVYKQLIPYRDTCIPMSVLERIRAEKQWGFWKAQFALYGSMETANATWDLIQRTFRKAVDGVQFGTQTFGGIEGDALKAEDIGDLEVPYNGKPTLAPLRLLDYRGKDSGHISFSPVLPPSGRELYSWYLTAKQRTVDAGFDFFSDFHVYGRYILAIELVIFTPPEEDRAHQIYRKLVDDGLDQGFSEYRTHVKYMDDIAAHFNFNNSALRRYLTGLKNFMDPNGILSPGKSGIWN
ncbi:hypothetical protein VTN77DRAFT_4201 [Rasamsonia byssochlamydoides]|uniref:uncharacterized protein n=1 Tax=Rasamsonia byssochlamydoides TaxID=89139 RepID=UPI0037437735